MKRLSRVLYLVIAGSALAVAPAFADAGGDAGGDDGGIYVKIAVCHQPPGNPENYKTIYVGDEYALMDHLDHGDFMGPCEGGPGDDGGDLGGTN